MLIIIYYMSDFPDIDIKEIYTNPKYFVHPADRKKHAEPSMNEVAKEEHSKNAIFMWYLLGVIFLIFGKFQMNIVGHLIFWVGGMFIASIASIATYLIRVPIFAFTAAFRKIPGVITLTFILSWVVDIAWDVFVVLFVINILNNIF